MIPVLARLYGGFFAVDLHLLAAAVALSFLVALAVVLGLRRLKGMRRMTVTFLVLAAVLLAASFVVFHCVLDYPIVVVRSFFALP